MTYSVEALHGSQRVLFELPCYPQFELEIHIVEVSYFTNIVIK